MLSRVERKVYQYFGQQEFFLRFGLWAQWTDGTLVLADIVVFTGFWDRYDYRFVPYYRYVQLRLTD